MKELISTQEKAKRYDEAIERGKQIQATPYTSHWDIMKEVVEHLLPELKESEDERIRKAIKQHFLHLADSFPDKAKWLAWLEKQGEQPTNEEMKELLRTEYEKGRADAIAEMHKHADKVEPKFHKGDWIVFNGFVLFIKEVLQGYYRTITLDGVPNIYDCDIEKIARHWTIQDAKDGDVLYSPSHRLIWIYKDNKHYYASINLNYANVVSFDNKIVVPSDVCPANRVQRSILFQKMEESNCKWDADKRELKKIEQKTTWKPSDLELEVLRLAAERGETCLMGLYEQLKKLKEGISYGTIH